jgi:hypothetical protein
VTSTTVAKGRTKNDLTPQLLWVNKDANSESLTGSEGPEKQTIYGHARRHTVKSARQNQRVGPHKSEPQVGILMVPDSRK